MKSPAGFARSLFVRAFGRAYPANTNSSSVKSKRRQFKMEPLENRWLLSAGLVGVPDWVPEGPAPQIGAGNTIGPTLATTQDVGGVNALAVDPANSKHLFAATVNGGVWETDDFTAATPSWTTTTDRLPSLSTTAVAFSPVNSNVIYAGTGSYSSLGVGAAAVGVYKSVDGGSTWQILNPTDSANPNGIFSGLRIYRIIPTALNSGQTVFLATTDANTDGNGNPTGGIYRTDDGGGSWTRISGANGLPDGGISDFAQNPSNTNQFFASIAGTGVFRLDLGVNTTWGNVTNNITGADIAASSRILLSVSGAGANPVWASIINNGGFLQRVYRGVAGGGTINWAQVGPLSGSVRLPPDIYGPNNQGGIHAGIEADPNSDNLVYLGGDTTSTGSVAGYVVRGDSTANTWTALTPVGGPVHTPNTVVPTSNGDTTAPHADTRDFVFASGGLLLIACDGGVYQCTNPSSAVPGSQVWTSIAGATTATTTGLQIMELYAVGYDSQFDIILGGAQDAGNPSQVATGGLEYTDNAGGDGGATTVDPYGAGGVSNRYFFGVTRKKYDADNHRVPGDIDTSMLPAAGLTGLTNTTPNDLFTTSVLNAIAPTAAQLGAGQSTRMVISGRNNGATPGAVYESNNEGTAPNGNSVTWTQIPTDNGSVTGIPFVSTTVMAYGGQSGGVDNPEVLYAASRRRIFLRTTAGGTLTATASQPGVAGNITAIALDPNDWRTAVVTDSTSVFITTNAGGSWTNITGNLSNPTAFATSLAFIDGPGVNAVLFSSGSGVFRMLTNAPGVWSKYGVGRPTTLSGGMLYNATDDVLLDATVGRGFWEIANASASVFLTATLQIFGDTDFAGEDDIIRLIIDGNNPSLLDVFLNGALTQFEFAPLQQINVYGLGGNDTLIVDSTNGLINVVKGIRYDGGDGNDQLQLLQTDGPTRNSDTYSVGPDIGAGISTIFGGVLAGTQTVFFENLEPVLDLVPAFSLTVNATPTDNAINYSAGGGATGFVTIDEHESITFANKGTLTIAAGSGADTIGINSAVTPTGLTGITITGGDPTDGDALIVTGVGVAVSVNTATVTITGATGLGGVVPITYSGIESLSLPSGIGDLTITTTAADDVATVTPGLSTGANSGTVESSGAVPQISFVNSGTFTANLGTGNDALIVNSSSNADTIAVSGAAVAITGRRTVNATGEESLSVNGQGGSDTFNVTPSSTVGIFIDGGDPVGALPGDLLNILAGGGSVTYNAGPETDEGSFVVGVNQPVSFDHIESFGITGSGPAIINGTNGPDTITVIARDASTHPAANGVQDFTVSVNTGPELLFINVATLTINALSGSDQVTLQTPAPNNAVWDVDVTVNGGVPATDTDRLIVQTPGAAPETAVFTPTAADAGTLDLTSLSSLVTITGTEALSYSGMGDNDSLTIVGTGSNDVFVHNPGATDQAGSIQVNGLLALTYLTLGSTGSLTASGGAGTDTLVANGTAANDSFTVGAAGQVNLNSRVVINVSSIETLTLEGLDGDDVFTLVPAISASVYTTMNFNGGTQASATGDRTNLIATGGDDNLIISGQAVSLGGKTVQSSGVEDIRLDALAGNDLITYNGVSGITENILVSSSNIAGGGQISAPGVTLVNFSGVERIDVNGNTPTPTETDTLTFAGTNAVDTFDINLAADGTDVDPILKLSNASSALLLTLRNYTNFATLNVLGLDGEDVFNVFTDATGPSRNLFVDGGEPAGKKKSTDNLNVFYVAPRPSIIHSAATQDPDAGLVDLDYGTARFLVQYDGIEQIIIRKA